MSDEVCRADGRAALSRRHRPGALFPDPATRIGHVLHPAGHGASRSILDRRRFASWSITPVLVWLRSVGSVNRRAGSRVATVDARVARTFSADRRNIAAPCLRAYIYRSQVGTVLAIIDPTGWQAGRNVRDGVAQCMQHVRLQG